MNRIILLLLSLSFSVIAKATAVTWTSGSPLSNPKFLDPNGQMITTAMGYTIEISFYSDIKGTEIDTESSSIIEKGGFQGESSYDYKEGVTYYVKAIVQNDSYVRSTDLLAFTMPEKSNFNVNFASGRDLTNPSGGSATWGDWTEKGGDVPEPTTCSLLLVGLAGMGLKKLRKRNKQA